MRYAIIAAILVGVPIGAALHKGNPAPSPQKDVGEEVAWIAKQSNRLGSPVELSAEGKVLVFHVKNAFPGDKNEDEVAAAMKPVVCEGSHNLSGLLRDGAKIRFDVTNLDDVPQPSATIDSCD